MGRAAREPCGGETPLELRQQPSVLPFPFVVISFPMKGGFVSMETTMDAVTKVRRLIQNDLRGKKVTNNFEPA